MSHNCCSHELTVLPDRPLEGDEKNLVRDMIDTMVRPTAVIEDIIIGSKFLGVVAGGRMGLSALLGAWPKESEKKLDQVYIGKTVKQITELMTSSSPFSISLGLAGLNASNTPDAHNIEPNNFPADDLIASLGKDRQVGLVGEFPFVESLRERVGHLHLFELRDVPGAVPQKDWETVLGQLDVLAVTGTALLTRKMGWFLSRGQQATTVILGPTTPLTKALFDHGADYLCGSVVTDMERVGQGVRDGLPFRKVKQNGGIVFTRWEKHSRL